MEGGLTIPNLFTAAGEVMTGFTTLSVNFVGGLWAHALGQIIIASTLVSAAIGLGYRIFLRRKRV